MAVTTDAFLERIGSFGRYQIALNLFFNLCYLFWWAVPVMIMVFIASEPSWKCVNNSTCPFTDSISIRDKRYKYRCNISREDWEFQDDFTSVVTEFNLVCDRGSLGFVSTSVIFAGFFVGSIVVGTLSDKFGRKRPLFICGFFCWLFNFVSAFAPTFWFFALCRSIVGFMLGGYSIPVFVLATEFSGIRHRSTAGALVWAGIAVGNQALAGCAYAIRDWRLLTIITGTPGSLLVVGWLFTPESIRWLLKKGRVTEARDILSKVARVNGKSMPGEALHLPNDEKIERLGDFRDLFMSVGMVHRTLASWLMWFAVSFIYWATAFSAPFIGGNIYINVVIAAVAGLLAAPLSAALAVKFRRKQIIVVSFILSAVGAIGALLLSDKDDNKGYLIGKIFMSMAVARLAVAIAFTLIYIFTAEMFPTTLRNVAMGTSTAAARVSALLSALAPLLLTVHRFLPFGIMAGLAVAAAVVCLTLPETHNQPTKENLFQEEACQPKNEKLGDEELAAKV
ncbi:solute carrier family 22 member 15-like [Stylophora pistillata]|uniref:solute carrier family 22 member 15-like n=1 Tax=Stylophora pistillata TaxID=50429 RepID=UPI000C04085D|nr:solute carrier family 22 member 15-like [Stylophora pistillata]